MLGLYQHGDTHVILRSDEQPIHRRAKIREVIRDNRMFRRLYRVIEVHLQVGS